MRAGEAGPTSAAFYDLPRRIKPLDVMRSANPHVLPHALADQREHVGYAGTHITQA